MTKTKATQAADLYSTARENPYVQRLIEDEELRDSLKSAFEADRCDATVAGAACCAICATAGTAATPESIAKCLRFMFIISSIVS